LRNGWLKTEPVKELGIGVKGHESSIATYTRERRDLMGQLKKDNDFLQECAVQQAAAFFGVSVRDNGRAGKKPRPKIDSFRVLLGLDRAQVLALLDAVVEWAPESVLLPTTELEAQIKVVQAEIAELNALLETRTAMWQKFHRPDDQLPKSDRERLKREESRQLDGKNAELRELRTRMRNWAANPANYTPTGALTAPITFQKKYGNSLTYQATKIDYVDRLGEVAPVETPIGPEYDVDGYRKLMALGVDALTLLTDGYNWDGWRDFENVVIVKALEVGVLQPGDENLETTLKAAGVEYVVDDVHAHPDKNQDAVAIQTGGSSHGGRVLSRGVRFTRSGRCQVRGLESFDATLASSGSNDGDSDHNYVPDVGDDSEPYQPE
jgi:hypothetical protein